MTDHPLSDLAREVIRAPRGAVLMRQGEIGKCAFFVVQGKLIVEREEEGKRIFIAEIGPRDLVGELAILDDAPRSATVTVVEDSLLIVLNKHRIRSIIRRSPNIAELIMKLICHKLRKSHDRITKGLDLSDPRCWIKICSMLMLTIKSEDGPKSRYASFVEHLALLLETPGKLIPEILMRLNHSNLIHCEDGDLGAVNYEYIQAFIYHCKEEYSNEPMDAPTEVKEYMAIRLIFDHFFPNEAATEMVSASKQHIHNLLLQSNLWQPLHPTYQQQRVKAMLNALYEDSLITQDPAIADNVLLDPKTLKSLPYPDTECNVYNSIRQALLGLNPNP